MRVNDFLKFMDPYFKAPQDIYQEHIQGLNEMELKMFNFKKELQD